MEDKIDCLVGQIVKIEDIYYQCLRGNGCECCDISILCDIRNSNAICDSICCSPCERTDGAEVIFKELIEVGKPQYKCGGIFQAYKYFVNPAIIRYDNGDISTIINSDYTIAFKTDKIETNMETKNFKPFNLEAAKAGKPVCTRDGRKVRIICFDRKLSRDGYTYPILALVEDREDEEIIYAYTEQGLLVKCEEHNVDLMMIPEKKEGYYNIYKTSIFNTLEEAEKAGQTSKNYIKTIKVDWEE